LISGDFRQSPWVKKESLKEQGAVLVWDNEQEGESLLSAFPDAIRQAPLKLEYLTKVPVPAASVSWAILRPQP
jgi:hypothetical protein